MGAGTLAGGPPTARALADARLACPHLPAPLAVLQIPFYFEAKLALAVYLWANGARCVRLPPSAATAAPLFRVAAAS